MVVHFLRHAHHQAVINDLKVFHISSHSAVFQHFYSKKKENPRFTLRKFSFVCCVSLSDGMLFLPYCAVFSASWERYLWALLAVSVSGNSSMILS